MKDLLLTEEALKQRAQDRIRALVDEMVPVANRVYYQPIFNKLKPDLPKPKVSRATVLAAKAAYEKGDMRLSAELIREVREGLENYEKRLTNKRTRKKKKKKSTWRKEL